MPGELILLGVLAMIVLSGIFVWGLYVIKKRRYIQEGQAELEVYLEEFEGSV